MNIKLTNKDKINVTNPDDIYEIMQRILLRENKIDREKEHFWIVGMNNANTILYIELVSMGTARTAPVDPMHVFRVAILKGAVKVVAVHNHPSGAMRVSEKDKLITDRLIQVGKIIDISVEDHLIISPATFLSFVNTGLMNELHNSTRFVPTYKLIEEIRKEEQVIREETNKKHKEELLKYKYTAIENLLAKDIPLNEIAKILNLPLKEVQKIGKKGSM